MRISLVICTKDRPQELAACLGSIRGQTVPPEEVVIVDAGRDDTARQTALSWQPEAGIRVKYLRAQPGLSAQKNIGVKNSEGEIVGFIDDDLTLDEACLENVGYLFRDEPGLGGVGCLDASIRRIPWPKRLFWRVFILPRFDGKGKIQPSGYPAFSGSPGRRAPVECLQGTAFYKKDVFDKLRFDEGIPESGGMEDVDFSFSVSRCYKLVQTSDAKVCHRFSFVARPLPERVVYMMIYYHYRFFKKYCAVSFINRLCFVWSAAGEVLRSVCWAVRMRTLSPLIGVFKAYNSIINERR